MKTASVSDVKARLSAYLAECAQEGPRFRALLNKSRQSIKAGKGLSRDDFWRAVRQRHHEQGSPEPG